MVGPGSSRDGIWGVVFGAVMGLRLRSPPSWVSGVDQPPRAAITTPGPPAGYLRFPGPDQTVIVGPYQVDRTNGKKRPDEEAVLKLLLHRRIARIPDQSSVTPLR